MKTLWSFLRREIVFSVALVAALLSLLLTPPSLATLQAIDTGTLCMLFSLMTVVAGLKGLGLFDRLRALLTRREVSYRDLALTLILSCFFLSMVATNDVALITLTPFTLLLLGQAGGLPTMLTVVLETVAANLGSMVTPIGNPQNLYLYASGALELIDFPRLTLPYAALSLLVLALATRLLPKGKVAPVAQLRQPIPRSQGLLYAVLSVLALLSVAKVVPAWVTAAAVLVLTACVDRGVLRQVDYTLLGTFVCFFIFSGSIRGYAPLRTLLEGWMIAYPLTVPVLASQIISNVPACLLLSPFTQDASRLMLGVNLGGLGTLVASLASLISFKQYAAAPGARRGTYLALFTLVNALMLALLLFEAFLLGAL